MRKFLRTVAIAGLLAAGSASGSVYAQTAVTVPALETLTADVTAKCLPNTPVASQSPECIAAIVLLLAYYPDQSAFAAGFIGTDGVASLAQQIADQRALLGIQTGSTEVDFGNDGGNPDTPSN